MPHFWTTLYVKVVNVWLLALMMMMVTAVTMKVMNFTVSIVKLREQDRK